VGVSRLCTKRCDYHPVCPCGGVLPADDGVPAPLGRWALFAPDERQVIELALRRHPWIDAGVEGTANRLADQLAAIDPWERGTSPPVL
jgi:hypothetical protein